MRKRDVVGKRIVDVRLERMPKDPDYYGPRVVCDTLYLEDGTRLTAHVYETTDQPLANLELHKPKRRES